MTDQLPCDLVEVRLLGVPIPLRQRSTEHSNDLLREMTLVAQEAETGDADLPARLVRLAAQVRNTYREFTVHADAQMDAAARAGIDTIDVVYHVPPRVAAFCEHLLAVIDEADAYCRQDRYLLTLPTPPDILAYQHWIVGEFIRQIRGDPPVPWSDYPRNE